MKCVGNRAANVRCGAPLLAALMILSEPFPAVAGEDPVELPPAAAEALEQNGSILEGSLIETLADGAPAAGASQQDSKRLIAAAERLLRTARVVESASEAVPESSRLAMDLRRAALHCLSHALGLSHARGPADDTPTERAEPAAAPLLAPDFTPQPPEERFDPPPVPAPHLREEPNDQSPVDPPSLSDEPLP